MTRIDATFVRVLADGLDARSATSSSFLPRQRPYLPILSFATFNIVHEQAALYFFTYKTASHLWLMPLLNFDSRTLARAPYEQLSQTQTASEDDDDSVLDVDEDQDGGPPKKRKRWWDYLPLCREHHPFDLQIISV